MRRWKRHAPASRGAASRSSPPKCARWPSSAHAAKEISQLIGATVERIDSGSRLVDAAGRSMDDIVNQVKRVTDLIAEISAASAEQSSGVEQVGQAVTQMDQATQQNAALVEQSAAAAASLKTQAEELVNAVAVFRFGQEQEALVRKAPARAARAVAKPVERRAPTRAANVTRIPVAKPVPRAQPAPAETAVATLGRTGTDDWKSF